MGTTRQQVIADRFYAERQEHDAAYLHMRQTGDVTRVVASDRRMAKLQQDLTDAGANIDPRFAE